MVNINSLLTSVPKLNGENYHDWKFSMSMILRRAGAWNIINGSITRPDNPTEAIAWDALSEEGLTAIALTVEQSQVAYIRDYQTGPEAWEALADIYERSSRANRIMLKRQLFMATHDTSKPIVDFITGITTTAARLKAIGVPLDEEEITDVIIYALAPSYAGVATALMQSPEDELTIRTVTAILVEAEEQLKKESIAYDVDGKYVPGGNLNALVARTKDRSPAACYRCGKVGHIARFCPAPAPLQTGSTPASNQDDTSLRANVATFNDGFMQVF